MLPELHVDVPLLLLLLLMLEDHTVCDASVEMLGDATLRELRSENDVDSVSIATSCRHAQATNDVAATPVTAVSSHHDADEASGPDITS